MCIVVSVEMWTRCCLLATFSQLIAPFLMLTTIMAPGEPLHVKYMPHNDDTIDFLETTGHKAILAIFLPPILLLAESDNT